MTTRSQRAARPSRSAAEWVSFAMASAVLLSIAVTIGVLWTRDSRPPELSVTMIGQPRESAGVTYVTAEVHNRGTVAALEVKVLAELVAGGEPAPAGEQVVDFLAGGASSRVTFVLPAGDLTGLTFRVESYTDSR